MEFRQIRYFLAVAEEGNIGRAATRLHISQPPLTRQIQQLEEELGAQLFIRTAKGVELTQAGEQFVADARNIRALMEQAAERTLRAGQGKFGRMDIGIFGSAILHVIPEVLHAFRARYPDVRILLHTMTKAEQIEALRQRTIVAGFNRILAPQPDIRTELVSEEPIVVALPESHALARHADLALQELKNEPQILFPIGARPNLIDKVWALCGKAGFEPVVSQEVGDVATAVALVAAGFGICLVSQSAMRLQIPGVTFRPLRGAADAYVDLSCIHRADDHSPLLRGLLEVIREYREAHSDRN